MGFANLGLIKCKKACSNLFSLWYYLIGSTRENEKNTACFNNTEHISQQPFCFFLHNRGKNTLGKVPSDYTRKIRAGLSNLIQY
jgi:hypothetical protein